MLVGEPEQRSKAQVVSRAVVVQWPSSAQMSWLLFSDNLSRVHSKTQSGQRGKTDLWKAWPSIRRSRKVFGRRPSERSYARTYSYFEPDIRSDS